jgi:integrase
MAKLKAPRIYTNADGTHSVLMQVFVEPFPRQSKTFCIEDYPSRKDALVAAKRWRDETRATLIEQRQQKNVRADLANYTLADLNAEYLKDPVTTALAYHKELTRNLAWWDEQYGTYKVLEFDVQTGRAAREKLIPGRSAGTVDRYIAAQRSSWNFGREAGLIPANRRWPPGLMLPEPRERSRYLTDEELPVLLSCAAAHSAVIHAAIIVAISTGVRQGELLRLTWADIDLAKSVIRVLITKNGRPRSVHLPEAATTVLKALKGATVTQLKGAVFLTERGQALTVNGLNKAWTVVRKAAGLTDFRWHDLRHCCASYLAQAGASLPQIAGVLGHLSVAATHRYAHLVASQPLPGHAALNAKLSGPSK